MSTALLIKQKSWSHAHCIAWNNKSPLFMPDRHPPLARGAKKRKGEKRKKKKRKEKERKGKEKGKENKKEKNKRRK